jgi:hypothetical protein
MLLLLHGPLKPAKDQVRDVGASQSMVRLPGCVLRTRSGRALCRGANNNCWGLQRCWSMALRRLGLAKY